jgi:hypothetical protein
MSNPLTISSQRVLISTPTYAWEQNAAAINEGPEVTIQNNVISLVYSASGSWTNYYCLGLMTASTASDPMNPASWTKNPNPIFQSGTNVYGPGHHSFTKSRDGLEDWIIYHSARYSGSGWTRQIRAQQFTWNADSTPNLGKPASANSLIQIPSGDQVRVRYQAENAVINNANAIPDSTSSNNNKVGNMYYPNSTVTFTIQCAVAGTYVIVIRDGNGSAGGVYAYYGLTVNNGNQIWIPVANSGWDMWGASVIRVNLNQGFNTLTFMQGNNFAELDEIDIFLDV